MKVIKGFPCVSCQLLFQKHMIKEKTFMVCLPPYDFLINARSSKNALIKSYSSYLAFTVRMAITESFVEKFTKENQKSFAINVLKRYT